VESRVLCGFPSSEGGDENAFTQLNLPPSERHFHSETPGFPASLSDFRFSDSVEYQEVPLKNAPKMSTFTDSCSEPEKPRPGSLENVWYNTKI